jgi:hypothetical protein
MNDFIESLKKKPVQYRKRVLFLTTTSVTGIIVLVWLSTFNFLPNISDEDSIAVDKQLRPIDDIKVSINGFIDTVKSVKNGMFGSVSSSTEESE